MPLCSVLDTSFLKITKKGLFLAYFWGKSCGLGSLVAPRVLVVVFGWFGTKIGMIWGHFYGMNESEQPVEGLLDSNHLDHPLFAKMAIFDPK